MTGTSNPAASLKVATDAWEALFRAQVAVMRQITAMPEFGKLSMREYDVLFNLRTCPGGKSRLVDLNKQLLISQPSLSRMVTRLEDQGLVVREPDRASGVGRELVAAERDHEAVDHRAQGEDEEADDPR